MWDSRREIEEVGGGGGVYGHNNVSISSGDRVSTVINHALLLWPHQGISTQEMEDLNGTTHTKGWAPQWGAGVQALLPQNGCTALGLRSCQMFAPLERLMNLRTAEQMRVLNGAWIKGAGGWGGRKKVDIEAVCGRLCDERISNWILYQKLFILLEL